MSFFRGTRYNLLVVLSVSVRYSDALLVLGTWRRVAVLHFLTGSRIYCFCQFRILVDLVMVFVI